MNGRTLGSSEEQRDLGVLVHRFLKVAGQVNRVVNGILAFISHGIDYKSRVVILELNKTLVRPQLEYCVQFWSSHYRKDVRGGEDRGGSSGCCLVWKALAMKRGWRNLFSLERRRLRGDLIEVYKSMRGMDRVDSQRLFPRVEESITRGHKVER